MQTAAYYVLRKRKTRFSHKGLSVPAGCGAIPYYTACVFISLHINYCTCQILLKARSPISKKVNW